MPRRLSTLDRLLGELRRGTVEPERYSTRSVWGRCEQLILTAALAALAIAGGMLLSEASARLSYGGSDSTR